MTIEALQEAHVTYSLARSDYALRSEAARVAAMTDEERADLTRRVLAEEARLDG